MWHSRLRKVYDNNFKQFEAYDSNYGIALRLGFKSAKEAWDKNPMIQGSVNPADLSVVPVKKKIKKEPFSYEEYLLLSDKEKLRLMKQAKHRIALGLGFKSTKEAMKQVKQAKQ